MQTSKCEWLSFLVSWHIYSFSPGQLCTETGEAQLENVADRRNQEVKRGRRVRLHDRLRLRERHTHDIPITNHLEKCNVNISNQYSHVTISRNNKFWYFDSEISEIWIFCRARAIRRGIGKGRVSTYRPNSQVPRCLSGRKAGLRGHTEKIYKICKF